MGRAWINVNKIASKVAALCIFIMMIISSSDVIGRYFFHHSLTGASDLIEILMVFSVFLGLAYIASEDGNIKADILFVKFPPRIQAILNVLTGLISLVIFILITWQLAIRAWDVLLSQDVSTTTLEIPIGPFLAIAAIGTLALCVQLLINIIANARKIFGKNGGIS